MQSTALRGCLTVCDRNIPVYVRTLKKDDSFPEINHNRGKGRVVVYMNISWDMTSSLLRRMGSAGMLKSTRDKLERQEETQRQVDFFEQKKDNLKNMKCGSVEEIAEKLNMLHSYEDQIAAAKAAYNSEQMWHILDESTERGEKIAEAVEKSKPKTPEERQEDMVEEALGIEGTDGILEEILDEVEELTEDLMPEVTENLTQEMKPENPGELTEDLTQELPEEMANDLSQEIAEEIPADMTAITGAAAGENLAAKEDIVGIQAETLEMLKRGYVPFDVRL